MVATCPPAAPPQQPADDEPSSQVTITVPPSRYHGEARTPGRLELSQPSMVALGQSWPSSHRLGVTQAKSGGLAEDRSPAIWEKGTTLSHSDGLAVRWEKYTKGSCFLA